MGLIIVSSSHSKILVVLSGAIYPGPGLLNLEYLQDLSCEIESLMGKIRSIPFPKPRPHFERVMKTRNTDGRPIPLPVWTPVRILWGDNIGTRNFKRMHK